MVVAGWCFSAIGFGWVFHESSEEELGLKCRYPLMDSLLGELALAKARLFTPAERGCWIIARQGLAIIVGMNRCLLKG